MAPSRSLRCAIDHGVERLDAIGLDLLRLVIGALDRDLGPLDPIGECLERLV